jgi:hypothetical protein
LWTTAASRTEKLPRAPNRHPPLQFDAIDAGVPSHARLGHGGWLPATARQG